MKTLLKNHTKLLSCFLLVQILLSTTAFSQTETEELNLQDGGKTIENVIEMNISKSDYMSIQEKSGSKITLKKPEVTIAGESVEVSEIHTRGKTTLYYQRKNFNIQLESKVEIKHGDDHKVMKKFYANCLSMDKYYFRNRLSYGLMEELKIFDLFYSYGEVRINDDSQGIYMIVERPVDYAMKEMNSPLVIRRGYDHRIEKIKTGKNIDKPEAKNYKNYYQQIYKSLNKYEGEELYKLLSQWLDVEMYMKWMAFNFFMRNGDYTDEIFLCISPDEDRFKIIPWDFDDVFANAPHEGSALRQKQIGTKLIFSSEDKLDQKIANDPYLYAIYLEQLEDVLNQLTAEMMKKVFEQSFAELYPYYSKPEIIGMAKYDLRKDANLGMLEKTMKDTYRQLVHNRNYYLQLLSLSKSN